MKSTVSLLLVLCVIGGSSSARAQSSAGPGAQPEALRTPHAAQSYVQSLDTKIDLQRDHYNLIVKRSWISSNDSFFNKFWGVKKAMTVAFKSKVALPTSEPPIENSQVFQTDPGTNMDQPWGVEPQIVSLVPAQDGLFLEVLVVVETEDRIAKTIDAVQKAAPLPADIFNASWIGYAKAVTSVIDSLFGVTRPEVPFRWTGMIKPMEGSDTGEIAEQYITLIAANDDGDNFLATLGQADVRYDEKAGILLVKGHAIEKHSYVVMKLERAKPIDLVRLTYRSPEPWATLAVSQFVASSTPTMKTAESIATYAENAMTQLRSELQLLIRTPRFSVYDRACALKWWTDEMLSRVREQCSRATVPAAQCPTGDLERFEHNLPVELKLTDSSKQLLGRDAAELAATLRAIKGS